MSDAETNQGDGPDLPKKTKGLIKHHKSMITHQFTQIEELKRAINADKLAPSFMSVAHKIEEMTSKVSSHSSKIATLYEDYLLSQQDTLKDEDLAKLEEAINTLSNQCEDRENQFIDEVASFTTFIKEKEALAQQTIIDGAKARGAKANGEEGMRVGWRPNNSLRPEGITEETSPVEFRKICESWREFVKEGSGGQEVPCSLVLPHLKATLDTFWKHRLGDALNDKLTFEQNLDLISKEMKAIHPVIKRQRQFFQAK